MMDIQMSEKILRLDMSIKTHHKDETNVRLVYHRVSSGCRAINSNVFVFFYLLKKAVSKQFFFRLQILCHLVLTAKVR